MKVVLGFSGGVDSSVCAVLLKEAGAEVYGLYLDNSGEEAKESALATARHIGIPLKVADIRDELEEKVCRPFTEAYLSGRTPNPCIICNPALKFRTLLSYADSIGAEAVATGHYAVSADGLLFRGKPANDQSYMLCRLTREQVARTVFPLGAFEKQQVRKMAEGFRLPVAHKPDSMEICFIPDNDHIGWIRRRTCVPGEGDLLFHGATLGKHGGIYRYTVGQRLPGLYDGRKLYVSRIDADSNCIELALWEELFRTEVRAGDFNWLCDAPAGPLRAQVRVRHTKWEMPFCTACAEGDTVRIVCDSPVRAPAPGQSAVLYDGDRVLGGGFIL